MNVLNRMSPFELDMVRLDAIVKETCDAYGIKPLVCSVRILKEGGEVCILASSERQSYLYTRKIPIDILKTCAMPVAHQLEYMILDILSDIRNDQGGQTI